MLWKVPPEITSEGRGIPGGWPVIAIVTSTRSSSASQRSRAVSAASCTARSGGSASKPQTWTTLTAASVAATSKLLDDLAHERDLAGEVDVVGAGGDAGLDHRAAAGRVGADEVEDDRRAGRHRRERVGVGDVGGDRRRGARADVGERALELRRVAPGGSPARLGAGQIARRPRGR